MSAATNDPLLSVESLAVGLDRPDGVTRLILRGIDFRLAPGETVAIVGESGSGKSTFGLALMGYLKPGLRLVGGSVIFDGHDLLGAPRLANSLRGGSIALVPQNASACLTPTMTIGRQLAEAIALHTEIPRSGWRKRSTRLLADVELPDIPALLKRYPHELSGGQQQRCALALALAARPKLLILDEPTTGLDSATQANIIALLNDLVRRDNTAMIYITHNLGVAHRTSTRIAVMYSGELVEEGPTRAVLAAPAHPYTGGLVRSLPSLRYPGIPNAMWGAPPAPDELLQGCRFRPRCPRSADACATSPAARPSDNGGSVRCHFSLTEPMRWNPALRTSHANGDTLLEVDGLSFAYRHASELSRFFGQGPDQYAVKDIGFRIQVGQTLGVIGESGSGKSTLLRLLLGLIRPHTGTARLFEHNLAAPLSERPPSLKRELQIVFQNPGGTLNPRKTVSDILAAPLQLYFNLDRRAARERAVALLEQVRLSAHYLGRFSAQLSGGEKQRVAIARAFAAQPRLILCDEVTSALDVSVQAAVLQVLVDMQQSHGTSQIFVSHDLAAVRAVADYVIVLRKGEICEAGPVDLIFSAPSHPYTRSLIKQTFELTDQAPNLLSQSVKEDERL